MAEESPPVLLPAEESIKAEPDTGLEPQLKSGEPAPEPTSEPSFVCDCGEWARNVCKGESFYKEHQGRRYCVLHYPGRDKGVDFNRAVSEKLARKNFSFQAVWFPGTADFSGEVYDDFLNFSFATFCGEANFSYALFVAGARFNNARFRKTARFTRAGFVQEAGFGETSFERTADFTAARFYGVTYFHQAKFRSEAEFGSSEFDEDVSFNYAHFKARASFLKSTFNKRGSFSGVVVNDSLSLGGSNKERLLKNEARIPPRALGENPSLDFQHARIDKPELVSFHTLSLRPHWFINVDARKFDFVNVEWLGSLHDGIECLIANGVTAPHRLLSIAYRQLAVNAEENHRYDEASEFRYQSMAARRREKWHGSLIWRRWIRWLSESWNSYSRNRITLFLRRDRLHWIYWVLSGYGERVFRAFVALAGIWFLFAWLFTLVGFAQGISQPSSQLASSATPVSTTVEDTTGKPLDFRRALTYSLAVMSLQKPEPKPLTGTAQTLVLLETILGPVQAALLALAIRRKFMR